MLITPRSFASIAILSCLLPISALGDSAPSPEHGIISIEKATIAEVSQETEPPQAVFVHGFGKFEKQENSVPHFLIVQKNQLSESGKFLPCKTPVTLSLPTEGIEDGRYALSLRLLTWGAVEACRPITEIQIGHDDLSETLSIDATQEEMLLFKGGTYIGEGRWKWIKALDAVSISKGQPVVIRLILKGGAGNYTGILISEAQFTKQP